MMSGKWDFALFLLNGGLPDFSAPFIISQMTSEKRLYHFYTHDLDNIRYLLCFLPFTVSFNQTLGFPRKSPPADSRESG